MPTEITAFKRIEKGVDNLISKYGSESAADIIEAIALEKNHLLHTQNINLQKLIEKKVIETFSINTKLLCTSNAPTYKNARKCCFYLLNIHCKMSPGAIKTKFKGYTRSRVRIHAIIAEMQQVIDMPQIDKELHQKFQKIDQHVIKFKTNPTSNI